MPNYRYKCNGCDSEFSKMLPISFDPKIELECECGSFCKRIICAASSFVIERETLGKWYKNKTGKDLLGEK